MAGPSAARIVSLLAVAVLASSLAAIFIRLADAPGVVVAAYRMVLAALVMLPWTIRSLRKTALRGRALGLTLLAGVLLAAHFATWITSLSYTSVAAAVTLGSTTPLWVALLSWLLLSRVPTLTILLGVLLAMAGGAVIGFGDLASGSAPLVGDALALAGAVFLASYLLLGRSVQLSGVGLGAYVGVAYGVSALVLLPLPWLLGLPYLVGYGATTFLWIVLLALVPQLVGHTSINYLMKHIDPTVVTTVALLEPVGASLLALLVFAEVPTALTVLGALVLLSGMTLTVWGRRIMQRKSNRDDAPPDLLERGRIR